MDEHEHYAITDWRHPYTKGTMRLQKLTLLWIPERKMEQNGRNINRPKTRRKKEEKKLKKIN
jgi:hypothetical protein